jgi:lysophospholipase L1-like esterase
MPMPGGRGFAEAVFWPAERFALRSALKVRRRVLRALGRGRQPAPTTKWLSRPVGRSETIVAGDSIAQRLPSELLAGLSEGEVVNHGYGGDTIKDVAGRFATSIDRHPHALILQVGTNDVLQGRSISSSLAAYRDLVLSAMSITPAPRIVLCALPPVARWRAKPEAVREFNLGLESVSRELGVIFLDAFGTRAADPSRRALTTDGVHLTREAYVVYASRVRAALDL